MADRKFNGHSMSMSTRMPAWLHACAMGLMAGLVLLASAATPGHAAEPPSAPVLRIEPGMHVNLVRAVAVDAQGRWAVTASDDKTARVWSVASGAAGPVLRVPIAEGAANAEGRLQAVAITQDGATVAVAGRTGWTWSGSSWVYVFDRASGRMLRRIDTGSPLPVVTLALSPDARHLVVGLGDEGGLKVFDFASGRQIHHDPKFAASIYALDFRADGRVLLAGAADGLLRMYLVDQGQLQMAASAQPPQGRLIAQARFSPDGSLIALGLEDTPQVWVLDGRNLQVVGTPTPAADGASAFSSLAWSPDGSELWGGGTHREGNQWLLRVWPRSNWAQFADRPVAGSSILALHTLAGERVLFVSGEPAWGVVDRTAQVQRRAQSPLASFNSMARAFQISADGQRLRYWYGHRQPMFEFDLATRTLRDADPAADAAAWVSPRTEAPGLAFEGWENRRGPGLNGRRLPLGELETSRSLAIAADGQRFVLGTDDRIWMFDGQGRPLWSQRTPSLAWAVNLTPDGKLVVAALQDGTLRWHRASDGAELLALLPHADRRRWVAWTPSGYFDAAAGAEDLLGWHINRGDRMAADFHPMWTLRERFRRADIIDRVLQLGDEAQAVQQANVAAGRPPEPVLTLAAALPPVIEIAGTPTVNGSQGEARLRVRVRSVPGAPVLGVRARADGRPAEVFLVGAPRRDAATGDEERDLRVRFGGQPLSLHLLAENRHGLSAAATLQVQWPVLAVAPAPAPPSAPAPIPGAAAGDMPVSAFVAVPPVAAAVAVATLPAAAPAKPAAGGAPAAGATGIERAPRLYVLAIGVGKFQSADIDSLAFSAKDARDFTNALKAQQGRLYRSVEVRQLIDEQATRANVIDGIDWLKRQVTQHDVGMLFVASHGTNDPKHGYLFVTHNFNWKDPLGTAISHKEFKEATESLAGKALFFIDTCHSGNVLGVRTRSAKPADPNAVINDLISADSGVVVFSASTGRQESLESPSWGNGAFTKSLVEGITGKADERKTGRVTHKMLDYYITERVKELTQGRQSAVTISPNGVPDFPLALLR